MERIEQDLDKQPSWLDLPEEEKIHHTYWCARGKNINPKVNFFKKFFTKKNPNLEIWHHIFHSKEECEAHASLPNPYFKWDGKDATPVLLNLVMKESRKDPRSKGVAVLGWKDGSWVTLKKYPKEIPLLGE